MPFFENAGKKQKLMPESFDLECAVALRKVTVEKLRRKQAWSRMRWADEFRMLRKELGADSERVKKALDWFSANAGAKGLPAVANARQFRKTFGWIEEKMAGVGPEVVVSDFAKKMAKDLGLIWPKGSGFQVPALIQVSLDNHEKFTVRFRRVGQTKTSSDGFIRHINWRVASPTTFVQNWMRELHSRLCKWKEFSGALRSFAFSEEHPEFQKIMRRHAQEYGDPKGWDKLKGAMDAK